jgi:hypothetical protein
MIFRISSLFSEPGFHFNVSYKVRKVIEKNLNSIKLLDTKFLKNHDTFLSLIITTGSKTSKTEAKGPDYDKKNNCITWALWLEYKAIKNSDDYLLSYCENIFKAISEIFIFYGLSNNEFNSLKNKALNEILSNDSLRLIEDGNNDLDLSKLEI